MSKKQITRVRKFLRSDATPLTAEAIDEIRNASKNIPNAERIMCKKHRIGASRYKDIINDRMPPEPTDEWRKIINSVSINPSSSPASEITTTLSDASSTSSSRARVGLLKQPAPEDSGTLIIESDIERLVNRCKKIVGNDTDDCHT